MKYKAIILKTVLFTFLITILSCSNTNNSEATTTLESKYVRLTSKYKDITFDSLEVYTTWDLDNEKFKYKGVSLDSIEVTYLPYNIKQWGVEHSFYACYKFKMNSTITALITRVPSYYSSSAIKLFVYDTQKDSIVKTLDLADSWGDAGDAFQYATCIYQQNNKDFLALAYTLSTYDHRAGGEPNDTIIDYWYDYSLTNISKNPIDTITKDSATIVKKHKQLPVFF